MGEGQMRTTKGLPLLELAAPAPTFPRLASRSGDQQRLPAAARGRADGAQTTRGFVSAAFRVERRG
jgi:hypothetical protein